MKITRNDYNKMLEEGTYATIYKKLQTNQKLTQEELDTIVLDYPYSEYEKNEYGEVNSGMQDQKSTRLIGDILVEVEWLCDTQYDYHRFDDKVKILEIVEVED